MAKQPTKTGGVALGRVLGVIGGLFGNAFWIMLALGGARHFQAPVPALGYWATFLLLVVVYALVVFITSGAVFQKALLSDKHLS